MTYYNLYYKKMPGIELMNSMAGIIILNIMSVFG